MARTIELLLIENVEGTGIVGDVVKVRKGFARNFLLPRTMATVPSTEKIKELAGKRASAEKQVATVRQQREALIKKLDGYKLEMARPCNDMGILYGAVTQQEIATALGKAGFPGIKDREIRLAAAMKRIEVYDLDIKFAADLIASIKLEIKPDRVLDLKRFSNELEAPAAAPAAAEGAAGGERGERGDRGGDRGDRGGDRGDRGPRDRSYKAPKSYIDDNKNETRSKGGWVITAESKAEAEADKAEKADKDEKPAKAPKAEKAEKADKPAKGEKSEKGEKAKKSK